MSAETKKEEEEERKTMDMVDKLAKNLCSNNELGDIVKCIDNALKWSDEKLTKYIADSLPDPEKSIYLSNTKPFNEEFRLILGISGIFANLINAFTAALDYHIKQADRFLNSTNSKTTKSNKNKKNKN